LSCVTCLPQCHYICSNSTFIINEAFAVVQNEFWKYDAPELVLPPLVYAIYSYVAVSCTLSQHNAYCFELVSTGVSYVGWMWIANKRHSNSRQQTVVVNTEVMVRSLYSVVNDGTHLRHPVLTREASVISARRLSVLD
jgi:hypothetical protein